jgi:hypothetical protein
MKTIRSTNLSLARYMNFGHNNTAHKVRRVVNSNYLSKMALGQMELGNYTAREIESALGYPLGWLDRDNRKLLKLTGEQYKLLSLVLDLTLPKQHALTTLLTQEENRAVATDSMVALVKVNQTACAIKSV